MTRKQLNAAFLYLLFEHFYPSIHGIVSTGAMLYKDQKHYMGLPSCGPTIHSRGRRGVGTLWITQRPWQSDPRLTNLAMGNGPARLQWSLVPGQLQQQQQQIGSRCRIKSDPYLFFYAHLNIQDIHLNIHAIHE